MPPLEVCDGVQLVLVLNVGSENFQILWYTVGTQLLDCKWCQCVLNGGHRQAGATSLVASWVQKCSRSSPPQRMLGLFGRSSFRALEGPIGSDRDFKKRYALGGKLGTGAFSKIYAVHRIATPRSDASQSDGRGKLCVKVIKKHKVQRSLRSDSAAAARMLRAEVDIHISLRHANIVRLHEAYETPTRVYLVMDRGSRDLATFLLEEGLLSDRETRALACQIGMALLYLHGRPGGGIIYRDLKPENVLLCGRRECGGLDDVRLCDFGLAVPGPIARNAVGTPGFQAPEVLRAGVLSRLGHRCRSRRASGRSTRSFSLSPTSWLGAEAAMDSPRHDSAGDRALIGRGETCVEEKGDSSELSPPKLARGSDPHRARARSTVGPTSPRVREAAKRSIARARSTSPARGIESAAMEDFSSPAKEAVPAVPFGSDVGPAPPSPRVREAARRCMRLAGTPRAPPKPRAKHAPACTSDRSGDEENDNDGNIRSFLGAKSRSHDDLTSLAQAFGVPVRRSRRGCLASSPQQGPATTEDLKTAFFYGPAVDVWAFGALIFVAQLGMRPTKDLEPDPMLPAAWRPIFPAGNAEVPLSPGAREVIERCLRYEPSARPTCLKLLTHPWFSGTSSRPPEGPERAGV
jgi:serine/threonine protein kinase